LALYLAPVFFFKKRQPSFISPDVDCDNGNGFVIDTGAALSVAGGSVIGLSGNLYSVGLVSRNSLQIRLREIRVYCTEVGN